MPPELVYYRLRFRRGVCVVVPGTPTVDLVSAAHSARVIHPELGELEGIDVRSVGGWVRVFPPDALPSGPRE